MTLCCCADGTAGVAHHVAFTPQSVGDLLYVDQEELLRADEEAVHVRKLGWTIDPQAVHHDTVVATKVFDHDFPGTDMKHRMPSRHQRVCKCEVAARAATDEELPEGKLEIVRPVPQSK
jgi:hypothetical protein